MDVKLNREDYCRHLVIDGKRVCGAVSGIGYSPSQFNQCLNREHMDVCEKCKAIYGATFK